MKIFYEQYEGITQLREIIEQQQAIIEHQRQVIDFLLHEIRHTINAQYNTSEQLADAYRLASSMSTMTGSSEK